MSKLRGPSSTVDPEADACPPTELMLSVNSPLKALSGDSPGKYYKQ